MARWKVEKCSLDGSEGILNALEADGWAVRHVSVLQSRTLGEITGGAREDGGKLMGEFQTRSVVIFAQRQLQEG